MGGIDSQTTATVEDVIYTISAKRQFAFDSPDYQKPWGAKNDDTHCPAFIEWIRERYGDSARFCDFGCAGGGLVTDAIYLGMEAIGIDGSDAPMSLERPGWANYPERFVNADLSDRVDIFRYEHRLCSIAQFHVISAWEFLEHIPADRLPELFANVRRHLADGGVFVGTVSMNFDGPYHQTVQNLDWWRGTFHDNGFSLSHDLPEHARARTDGGSFVFVASMEKK